MENWAVRMTNSVMMRTPELNGKWEYDNGVIFKGIELLWRNTGEDKYFDFIKKNMDFFIDETGGIRKYSVTEYNIDHVNNGKLLFLLYKETGLKKYKKAAFLLREQLKNHPRTSEGAFWHKQIYPYQIWLDGLYMGSPFYAEFIKEFGETSEFDDVTKQFLICEKHAKDPETGLLYHAWDEKKVQPWCDKETGLSKNFWGRSVGWYVMAIVDVLDYIPEDHKDKARIIEILNEVLDSLLRVQDEETGLWYQVLNEGDRKGNYLEASASCMILYAIAKGSKKGYLPNSWFRVAKKTYKGIIDEFITVTQDGLVNLNKTCSVAGLGGARKETVHMLTI
ncbi:glycoside hydrolase family 88/105 protein [Clostridium lacusfryxellense]|uniref:glycoside hydrolase family 88/105 protein n=1 Tax=Clostridium lacusfryxellense TaxID=205328 RepID=UPI001FE742E2|nr:glycoside hydrolase family 88 protein [Clostridium lacusfryxellense]